MLYFVNPAGKGKRRVSTKRKAKKAGKRRKFSAKQLANQRRFARMAKARAKPRKKTRKRATTHTGVAHMAKRRRKAATKRRRSHRRRSAAVTRHVRRRSSYHVNPRRKARRRARYHRNPSILGQVKQVALDTALVLGGGIGGRVVGGLLPSIANPYAEAAKGTLVAVGIGMLGRKFLGGDKARFLAAGAMQPVLKNLVLSFAPGASAFLGDYEPMGAYQLGDPYANGGYLAGGATTQDDVVSMGEGEADEIGSYDIY